jgi:hypothetical protein
MRRIWVTLLAALAVTLTIAAPASAGIPANPKWESSAPLAPGGIWSNGGFFVYNNCWNSTHGPQTIWANSFHDWGVESTQPQGTAVQTYPNVQLNFSNLPISKFSLLRNGFTERMPANTPGLDAEFADDVWLNGQSLEMMIWTDNFGQTPAGSLVAKATIFGQQYTVWHGGTTWTFLLNHRENSGRTYILASIRWLINHHKIPASVTISQVGAGWEIASTNGRPMDFTMTNYWLHFSHR